MSMLHELSKIRDGVPLYQEMRIAGKLVGSERRIDVINPFTGKPVGSIPKASVDDIRNAFRIARAFKSPLTRFERSRIMLRASEILRANTDAISDLITAESGLCKKIRCMKSAVLVMYLCSPPIRHWWMTVRYFPVT